MTLFAVVVNDCQRDRIHHLGDKPLSMSVREWRWKDTQNVSDASGNQTEKQAELQNSPHHFPAASHSGHHAFSASVE